MKKAAIGGAAPPCSVCNVVVKNLKEKIDDYKASKLKTIISWKDDAETKRQKRSDNYNAVASFLGITFGVHDTKNAKIIATVTELLATESDQDVQLILTEILSEFQMTEEEQERQEEAERQKLCKGLYDVLLECAAFIPDKPGRIYTNVEKLNQLDDDEVDFVRNPQVWAKLKQFLGDSDTVWGSTSKEKAITLRKLLRKTGPMCNSTGTHGEKVVEGYDIDNLTKWYGKLNTILNNYIASL